MYFLLIFFLIVLLIFNMLLFPKDVFCPPVALNGTFLLSALVGLLMYHEWDLPSYGWQATLCIIGGLMVFTATSYFTQCLFCPPGYRSNGMKTRKQRIDIPGVYLFLATALCLFTLTRSISYVRMAVSSLGYDASTLPKAIAAFKRIATNVNTASLLPGTPMYLLLLQHVSLLVSYFCVFMMSHNLCFRVWKKTDYFCVVIFITWAFQKMVATAGRLHFLSAFSMLIYSIIFFANMYHGFHAKVNARIVKYTIPAFCGLLVFMLVITVLRGASSDLSDWDLKSYLCTYISAGTRNLDLFFQKPLPESASSGYETFTMLALNFNRNLKINRILEFRNVGGVNTGNIYTSFRRFYADYGAIGVIILTALHALIISSLYFIAKRKAINGKVSFSMFLCCYYINGLFLMAIEESFFSLLSRGQLLDIAAFYFLYRVIAKRDILITIDQRRLI